MHQKRFRRNAPETLSQSKQYLSIPLLIFNVNALDNPHNINNTISCGNCHTAAPPAGWWTEQDDGTNGVCGQCHNAAAQGMDVKGHSSTNTSTQYGTWSKKCTDCHNPHTQQQNRVYKTASYLNNLTDKSTAVTTSSLTKTGAGWTTDQWKGKILIPNVAYQAFSYRISGNDATTIYINTGGGDAINLKYIKTGQTFAIVYGKLVKEFINGMSVRFFRQTGANSFADGDATIDGICEVCHTQTAHFRNNGSGSDQAHTNIISGLQGTKCSMCHLHTGGFKLVEELQPVSSGGCTTCHAIGIGNRANVMGQFSGNSHHIQGVAVSDTLCYQCHWEANSDGSINPEYHNGSSVNLVIYGAGVRPSTYSLGTTAIQYTANGSRTEIQKINSHCLGCHSNQNNNTQPFGDGKTPKQYAWDGTSVGSRYSQTGTTAWGKYSGGNITPKNTQTKAYSAHGNAANNQGGWDLNETWTNTRNGSANVACYDCHNSHGSGATGTTTSYTSGTTNGGILKDATSGKGGYSMTYKPASGGSAGNKNAYNPGAGLCFDCHQTSDQGTVPWGYSGTFGATQAIMGYWDTAYFGPETSGSEQRFSYKSKSEKGGHFGASSALSGSTTGTINGLCTPCHDPHGVSPTLGGNMQFAVPLLKGTWLESPYKEDAAPANNTSQTERAGDLGYHIDQNTFGSTIRDSVTGISQTDSQFAGLCLNCHAKNQLTDGANGGDWKSKDRIHESVKGWGANAKHKYSCSKCHVPHNSALPRLMATNCLNSNHKGRVTYTPFPVLSGSGSGSDCGSGSGGGRVPGSWSGNGWSCDGGTYWPGDYSVTCHENQTGSGTNQSWNNVTPWVPIPVITSGPSAGSFIAAGINVQATIIWATDAPSTSRVDYGLTSGYGSTANDASEVTNHSVTITMPATTMNHQTIHFRVRSSTPGGETVSGDYTFYISVPPVPTLTDEPNVICAGACSVTLQYSATDPDNGPIEYYVEVDDDPAFGSVNYNSGWISGTSWSPTLPTNTTWYWRVKARDANHTTAQDPVSGWSATDSFIMSDGIAPPQVTLTSPADTTGFADYYCGGSPGIGFSWNAVPPVAEYYVEVSTDSTFTTVNYPSGWISGTSWSAGIAPGATYYWRVQAKML